MKSLILALTVAAVPLTPAAPAALAWGPCDGGMECTTLTVPLDWQHPDGRKVTLALGRLKATGPSQGTVLVNYGGPGAAGITVMGSGMLSPGKQPFDQLRQHMDIVTWDPRGYGLMNSRSTPVMDWSCLKSVPWHGMPPLPTSPAEFTRLAADSRTAANVCRQQDPALFDHMDTLTNARDMEAIRRALGVARLNLYMGSYGSVYGQTYADLYPDRVRTMVIDGGGDHSRDFDRTQDAIARDNVVRLQRFSAWCAAEADCALHGRDVPAVVAAALDWPAKLAMAGRLVRGDRKDFAQLAADLAKAEQGDRSAFPNPSVGYPVSECHEWPAPHSFAELHASIDRLARIDPALGAAGTVVPFTLMCVDWPGTVNDPPRPLPHDLPPLLGVGSWTDFPATNRVVSQVPGSGSVYHDGGGHELYAIGNTCVIPLVDQYFLTAKPPTAVC
ncbi:alpha/beta fold hydrolase [Kutzneria kofuensis]|uniref:Pimeloyl-ACP methyl ester carboxylesterase n=1 Tax=Kutzneria kofuensis TaxID=103725 RepID=A0A7W9NIW2_9PSEU|nr:alpha/beta fold hydrolase [Kutzneria kofuensis]MBB5893994.1 pimeloyl-ACP methyl ester carboxylesterase [Kutzneria kofuensis]